MMLLLGLVVLQDPPKLPDAPPAFVRVWKPNQKDRYEVTVDIKDAGGETRSEFQLELRAPKNLPKGEEVAIEATFRDQVVTFGEVKKRVKGPFGTASLVFRPTGLPVGLLAKTHIASLMVPLYGWYLPEQVEADGTFTLRPHVTDDRVTVTGKGVLGDGKDVERSVKSSLTLTEGKETLGSLELTAWFDNKSGKFLRSDSEYTAKGGTARITVRSVK